MAQNFIKKEITPEVISTFLDGHDPQERIVNFDYKYKDDKIKVYYRDKDDNRCVSEEPFHPFLWATREACLKLKANCEGGLSNLMKKMGIAVKALDVTNKDGEVVTEILDGYTFMFYATKPMSYSTFLNFFKTAGNAVYSDRKKSKSGEIQQQSQKEKKQYLVVTPVEQYMIATGKRMFKGYEDYDETLRLIFDLETTGLNTKTDRIEQFGIRFNRPVKYKGEYMTFEKTYRVEGDTEEEKNQSELWNIINFIKIIYTFKPDIITAHNGETFDWNMIIDACIRLGTSIEELSAKYFNGESITKNKRQTILKLGGEIETFNQTIVPGTVVTDSLHAVRRAQALDSNMLFSNLKYVTKYSKIVKPDRVYVPGDKISEIWNSSKRFMFNDEDGDWYIYDPEYVYQPLQPDRNMDLAYFQRILDEDRAMAKAEAENDEDWDGDCQGKYGPEVTAESLYNDYLESIRKKNEEAPYKKGKADDKFTLYTKNFVMDGYREVAGKYIVNRYLLDDLWECDKVEHRYNTTNFLICKMLPVPYQKCITMGTAGQWKALMMAWSYENNLAIPMFGENHTFTGGLSRLLKVGYVPDLAKFDYNSLYPSIILSWEIKSPKDLMDSMLKFLAFMLSQRQICKDLKKAAGKEKNRLKEEIEKCTDKNTKRLLSDQMAKAASEESFNDKKQSQYKVLCNSYFGSYSCVSIFPWGDLSCGERTTCTGRQCLRLMISHFTNLGYEPIVGDTDGFNFQLAKNFRYTKEHPYIGKGLSKETKKGKEYYGFEADVAEFNDTYMGSAYFADNQLFMGLGIDEVVSSSINFSRKNYSDYFPDEPFPNDVKMVGNTIKSKKMPEYIAKFLEKGIRLLLQKRGQEFLDEYYAYIEKIYNYKIPLKQIATKGKVKKSIEDYIVDCNTITKAGRPKSRQAWMELAIRDNLNVHMGETIYYINTGKSKSHADVKKVTHYYMTDGLFNEKKDSRVMLEKEYKKDTVDGKLAPKESKLEFKEWVRLHHPEVTIEDEIILNCRVVPAEVVDSENDVFCAEGEEYNAPKYIEMFNKRITPLLVCFHPDTRSRILINNPDDRQYFTAEECELCSGYPNKPSDQDTYEQLMTMEDKEIRFWKAHPEWEIPYLKECGMDWDEIVADYDARMAREKELGIEAVREKFDEVIHGMTGSDFDDFEEGVLPSSLNSIIMVDPVTGSFVSKDYPDIVIGTIYDVFDAKEEYYNRLETMDYSDEELATTVA